jgi:hypothetical protein
VWSDAVSRPLKQTISQRVIGSSAPENRLPFRFAPLAIAEILPRSRVRNAAIWLVSP